MARKNFLKVETKNTPEMVSLAQKLGSKNKTESLAAAEVVASVTSAPLQDVIQTAPVFSNQFTPQSYGPGDRPVAVLSDLWDVKQPGYMLTYSATQAGGLNTNEMTGESEVLVNVISIDGAASLRKKYLRNQSPRLETISTALARLAQEVLVKENLLAVNTLMGALAAARIDGSAANTAATNLQIIRAGTAGVFGMADFNALLTKYRRVVSSWTGGTPVGVNAKITDLFGSPEWMAEIRSIAYQPQNTRNGATTTSGATSLAAPDDVRSEIFNSAGLPSLFDVNLHEYNELGVGQIYNNVFANYATGTYGTVTGASGATFNSATEQAVIGLNLDWQNLISLSEAEVGGATWSLSADDQFPAREDKIGWFGSESRGYVSVDNRGFLGYIY